MLRTTVCMSVRTYHRTVEHIYISKNVVYTMLDASIESIIQVSTTLKTAGV